MADIYGYISFIFLFDHVLSLRTTVQSAADDARLLAYSVKVMSVRQGCVGPAVTALARAGKSLSCYMKYLGLES